MLVMKFGGTSVGDAAAIRRLVAIVRQARDRHPLVVVSAMAGATNTLLACAQLAATGKRGEAGEKLATLATRHAQVAEELALPQDLASLQAQLDQTFAEVRTSLDEIAIAGDLAPRLCDAVAARGELLSSPIVTAALRAAQLPGVWFDIRPALITDSDFTRAAIQFEATNPRLAAELGNLLANHLIPVTQGFIGSTIDGETTTIGRGGSDYSAAIIGAALDAEEIQIWTDVDGIMTTDPRIVPEAAKVKIISFAEAAELAYFGAKVLHPSTLLPAMAKEIPVSVRNAQRPEVEGTLIVKHAPPSRSVVKAIAFKRGITVVDVTSDRMLMAYGFLARLFDVFARHQTAVDMVATSEVSVSMTLDDARHLDQIVAELQSFGEVEVESDRAVICLVGETLKTTPGVAARIFSSIDQINVWMISHGASAINVSFIVADAELDQAVHALHDEFFHELDEETFEDRGRWSVVGVTP